MFKTVTLFLKRPVHINMHRMPVKTGFRRTDNFRIFSTKVHLIEVCRWWYRTAVSTTRWGIDCVFYICITLNTLV